MKKAGSRNEGTEELLVLEDSEGDLTMKEAQKAKKAEVQEGEVSRAEKRKADIERSPEAHKRTDGDHDWEGQVVDTLQSVGK